MNILRFRTSFAVFFLFFGISVLESFRTHSWIKAAFWVAIGVMFLIADNMKGENQDKQDKERA